jgi:Domain of unknown function (DUF1772)
MEVVQNLAEVLATFCCSLFAGAAVYITLVEHPARMECGPEVAATEFPPSYRRAAMLQASLAIPGFLLSLWAWIGGASLWWAIAGILLGLVAPFTLLVILPVNTKLLEPTLDKRSEEAAQLLSHWGRLHAVRSVLSVLALLIFLSARP